MQSYTSWLKWVIFSNHVTWRSVWHFFSPSRMWNLDFNLVCFLVLLLLFGLVSCQWCPCPCSFPWPHYSLCTSWFQHLSASDCGLVTPSFSVTVIFLGHGFIRLGNSWLLRCRQWKTSLLTQYCGWLPPLTLWKLAEVWNHCDKADVFSWYERNMIKRHFLFNFKLKFTNN